MDPPTSRSATPAPAADDSEAQAISVSPLRGPLGGAIWSTSGTIAATFAWELALLRDLPSPRVFISGWADSLVRAGPVILPAFVGCYVAYWSLRFKAGGKLADRRRAAIAFSAVWHFFAH